MDKVKPYYYARKPVYICGPDEPVRKAARTFKEENIGSILVKNESGEELGLFTDNVLFDVIAKGIEVVDKKVGELELEPVVSLSKDAEIEEVMERFRENPSGRIIMVDSEGKVEGVLKRKNIERFSPFDAAERMTGK